MRAQNQLLTIVAVLAMLVMAFFAGGAYGFGQGFAAALYSHQSTEALNTAAVLGRLKSGKAEEAQALLETALWSQLSANGIGRDAYRSWFDLPYLVGVGSPQTVDRLAARAAQYWLHNYPEKEKSRLGQTAREVLTRAQRNRVVAQPTGAVPPNPSLQRTPPG